MTPFRRDGHLTDLALDLLVEDGSLEGTEAHLASCATCRDRLEAAAAVELPANPFLTAPVSEAPVGGGLPIGASQVEPTQAPIAQAGANRPWMMLGLLAAAAVALLVAGTQLNTGSDPDDGIRLKGSGLTLQVFRDEGDHSERLRSGDRIAPGDRLGFRVRSRDEGHLMILGVDARDEAYLCYPQGRDGESMPVDASNKPLPLPEAIRMDETPGTEQLIAVVCDEPFSFDEMAAAVREDALPDRCTTDEVDLEKR